MLGQFEPFHHKLTGFSSTLARLSFGQFDSFCLDLLDLVDTMLCNGLLVRICDNLPVGPRIVSPKVLAKPFNIITFGRCGEVQVLLGPLLLLTNYRSPTAGTPFFVSCDLTTRPIKEGLRVRIEFAFNQSWRTAKQQGMGRK